MEHLSTEEREGRLITCKADLMVFALQHFNSQAACFKGTCLSSWTLHN